MPPETHELEKQIRQLEERLREQEAELAGARAEVAELQKIVDRMGYVPQQNAAPEGADAPDDPKDAA